MIPWFLVQHLHNLIDTDSSRKPAESAFDAHHAPETRTEFTSPLSAVQGKEGDSSTGSSDKDNDDDETSNEENNDSSSTSTDESSSTDESDPQRNTDDDDDAGNTTLPQTVFVSENLSKFRSLLQKRKELYSLRNSQRETMSEQDRELLSEQKMANRNELYNSAAS